MMPEYTLPRVVLGDIDTLERELETGIAGIRAEHPLAPVTILIENTMLRDYLRQRLAFSPGGHINLKIVSAGRFADQFTRTMLMDKNRKSLPKYGDRILARAVAESGAGDYFWPVAYSTGFAETLRGLFREFHTSGIDPDGLAGAIGQIGRSETTKLAEITSLFRRYEERRHAFFTPDDIIAAIDQVDPETIRQMTACPVFIYGIWNPSGIQLRLFEHLMRAGIELRVLLPETGTDVDEAHAAFREWLTSHGAEIERPESDRELDTSLDHLQATLFAEPETATPEDQRVRLLSAPDAPREVREAARTCLMWAAEGIPFHQMAVVYRHNEPYRTLIDQIFHRAGIVTYLHSGRPLISEPAGQRLSAILSLIDADLPRSSVMEFITETVLPESTRQEYGDEQRPIQPAVWDQITREAGIVQGAEQWTHRLDLLESSRREFQDPDAEVSEDDPLELELQEIARLRTFIADFAGKLAKIPDEATWTQHLEAFRSLVNAYVEGVDGHLEQLKPLEALEDIEQYVSFERFRETVRHWLLRQNSVGETGNGANGVPRGQFGRSGVNVFDIGSLRHVRFDAVIVLGVAERQFPPPPRQDPLLLDRERSDLNRIGNWHLPLRSRRAEEESMTFAMAVSAARERLQISFPRSEAGSTRSYLPSHFFRAAASALTGQNVEAGEIDSLDQSLFTRVPAGSFRPPEDTIPLDAHEYDRILLERDPDLGVEVVGRHRPGIPLGRLADSSRRSSRFTEFDGNLDPESARQIGWTAGRGRRAISPSRLETFSTCPFRFFLRYVLRLEPVEEPEALERIDALHRGSLIHEILEQFLADLRSRGERPSPELRPDHLNRLNEIARECCQQMESTGLVGYPVLWEYDQIAIFEDLEEWYDREVSDLAGTDLHPETFELRFGWARRKDEGGEGSRDKPYTLRFPGGELRFQGRVDRVDVRENRAAFRVIDYKTGRSSYYRPNTFGGGRSLQLPIYLLATSDLLGINWETSQAEYFFPTRRGEFQRVIMEGPWLRENQEQLIELLSGIAQGIEHGIFPQVPEIGNSDNCMFCDFKELCPVNVKSLAQRKRANEPVYWLRQVIEADA